MSLFEFLMILLSIIVGLGISELLTGFARILRDGRMREFCLPHATLWLTLLVALLQIFWESWSLGELDRWTFPAMLLMFGGPALLYLVSHLALPEDPEVPLAAYYYSRVRPIYGLLALTAVVGVLFRPLAFDYPLLVVDNASSFPIIAALVLLAWKPAPLLHRILVPICFVAVVLDTLTISYSIG